MLRGMIRAALLATTLALAVAACGPRDDAPVYQVYLHAKYPPLPLPAERYIVRGAQVVRETAGKPTGVVGDFCLVFAPATWACPDVAMRDGRVYITGVVGESTRQVTRGEWLMAGLPPISAPDAP